jgi:acyl-CoA thioesterase-2
VEPGTDGAGDDDRATQAFVDALGVTSAGDDVFRSASPAWGGSERMFGGLVVAQALSAAAATVGEAKALHSVHGSFVAPVPPGSQPEVVVRRVRDGRSVSLRSVELSVDGTPAFLATCSFHQPEPGDEYQLAMPDVPRPGAAADRVIDHGPWPLDVVDLGPTGPAADGTFAATRRLWVRTRGRLPDEPRVHWAVAGFVSDMTGSSFRPGSLGTWGAHTDASLDHALWLHRPFRLDQWVLFDLSALVNSGARATVRGVLYDESGRLIASMAQELLIRRLDEPRPVGPTDRA